jgi:hypothetical protein
VEVRLFSGVLIMKTFALASALLVALLTASTASAQYVVPYTSYYAPTVAPAYYAAPVVVAPRRAYYAPAPVVAAPVVAAPVATTSYYAPAAPVYSSYYAPAAPVVSSYYAPAVAAPVYAQPVVVARYGRSIYGTRQVYYPGQPVLNTVRAVTP